MMGPIRGEINMAPITTAVESTFKPMLAMTIEKTRIHTLKPRNSMSFLIPSMVAVASARSRIFMRSIIKGRRIARTRLQGVGFVDVSICKKIKTPGAGRPGSSQKVNFLAFNRYQLRLRTDLHNVGARRKVAQVNRELPLHTDQRPLAYDTAVQSIE